MSTAALVALAAVPRQQPPTPADIVLVNGKIVTVEANQPQVEALAIGGSRVAALGTTAEVKRYVGPKTQVIDLAGRLAIPGFVEGHGHFTGVGLARLNLNLMKAKTWDEIVAMVEQAAKNARPGQWIYGRGWHQEKWDVKPSPEVEGFPTHASLSRVSPNNPVLLTHASGHATFANAKAMEVSDITPGTPNPPGGDFLKDAKGNPTGLFRERASDLIRRGAGEPPRSPEEEMARARRILELASEEAVSKGVTSFQDAGSGFGDVDLMKKLIDEGRINVRLWIMLRVNNQALAANLAKYRTIDYADGMLTVRGIKRSIDGALGPRGAWLLEAYSDKPGDSGHNTTTVARNSRDREARHAARLPTVRACHRRSREPRDPRHLRGGVQGESRQEGSALARGTRAAPEPRGHSALRSTGCDRLDAGGALHVGRALRPCAARRQARRRKALTSGRN